MTDWNPRYVAYARSHGREPEDQRGHDRQRWPGGQMTGFLTWMSARWSEFEALTGRTGCSPEDHAEFDAWLIDRTDRLNEFAERLLNDPAFIADAIACERRLAEVTT